jgi:hypothetical protein
MIHETHVSATARGFGGSDQLDLFGGSAPVAATAADPRLCRIGHDLRTALNAIMGFSEIMTAKLHGPLGHPKYEEYISHVRVSGQALLAVSDEVLALANHRAIDRGYSFTAGWRECGSAGRDKPDFVGYWGRNPNIATRDPTTEIVMKKQSEQQKQRTNNLVKKNFAAKIRRQKKLAERAKTANGGWNDEP